MTDSNSHPVWIEHVESLLNKAIALDEETQVSLADLSGKVIAFEFINTSLKLYLFPNESGLYLKTVYEEKPNVLIKGTPMNFVNMLAAAKDTSGTLPSEMELIGDIGLAQRFQHIMQNIEVDLEEPLSRIVGDTAAYQLGQFVRNTHRFAKDTTNTLANDISEYLRFESELLPDALLVKEFCDDVDQLREDVDRMTQRVAKLEAKRKEKQT